MKLFQAIFPIRSQKNDQDNRTNVLSMEEMNTIWGGQPESLKPASEYWWVEENTSLPLTQLV